MNLRKLIYSIIAIALMGLTLAVGPLDEQLESLIERFNPPKPGTYKVVQVADGDTILVDMKGRVEKVRLIGVDSPEIHHPSKPVQCFGFEAAKYTADLVQDKRVRLEADPASGNRDRYQRLLRYVYLEDERLLNSLLIQEGFAFAYLTFPHSKLEEFKDLEKQAELGNAGLWNACPITIDNGYPNSS